MPWPLYLLTNSIKVLRKLPASLAISQEQKNKTSSNITAAAKYVSHFTSTFLGDRSSLWLLLPTGDSEYGDASAATGLNRYYNKQTTDI